MASHVPVAIQDENFHIHKGKTVAVGKSDACNVQQKGLKVRKALADLSKPGKTSFMGSKVPVLKQKSAVPGRNGISVPKNGQLTEEQIKQCNEWAKEGIEHIHFSGNDMHKFEKEVRECNVDNEVNEIMAGFHNWTQASHLQICSRPMEVVERHDKVHMEFEPEPELLWSPRGQLEPDVSWFLRDNKDQSNYFMEDGRYHMQEFKLKGKYEVETT